MDDGEDVDEDGDGVEEGQGEQAMGEGLLTVDNVVADEEVDGEGDDAGEERADEPGGD